MNRFNRAFAAVPVVLLRILGGMSIAYAASAKLPVTPYAQEKSNWCWVATTKSVVGNYPHPVRRIQMGKEY